MTRSTCLAFCFIAFASAPAVVQADFTVNDVIASDPSSDLPAPEFDRKTKRIIWEDRSYNLWVGAVDLATGKLNPRTGKGTLVDTGLSPTNTILNTPRYTWGGGQSAIVYNKTIDGIRTLSKAVEASPNSWVTSLLEDGDNRWKANGSPDETTDPPRIVYNRLRDDGVTVTSWRTLDDPASEQSVVGVQGGRFFGSERSVVYMKQTAGVIQIYNVPFDTMVAEQVSFGTQSNYNAFIWFAPEFQQYVIAAMTDWEQLAFYRKINGVWTMFNQFPVPSAKPLLSSPEGFVANGKSYVAVVACDELGAGGFVGQPVGPSEIWVVGIDPARPFARRIDDPLHTAQRAEPEPFLLDTGPVVFYSEVKSPNMQWLKRASTGLAADTGYEVAHFGGAWSGAFRDNKNCSCTPYGLATRYASAYDVPMQNTQFVHATLGPENQLYYGAIDTTGGGSMRQLVVLDTTTGAEAYRLSEQTGLETLSATNALVDLNGAYYVPGNDALRKYNSGGQLQWAVPTHGLARSAQFAPDGNIVFFTWNGWSYIVSQDGALLAEANMTGSRTFPENPVCLAPGDLSTDCAYVGSPAIDPASKRTFVTQIRTNNTSIVQGFKYQTSPTYLLKNIWGTRITLAGIASNPVLSADHLRLYVQDGVGNLHAYDATNGNLIWTFPLGFTSNSPPVVTANGFIMPGGTVDRDPLHNFVGLVQDQGNSAAWVVQNTSYSPKSFAAAGVNDRFVLMGIDNSTLELKLLVVDPTGVLSASSWGTGDLPTSIQGVSLRDDGWVFVQTSGTVAVKAFAPAP